MPKKLKKYKVIKCKNCGGISVNTATKVFKCRYCGKTCKIFKKSEHGISVNLLKAFDNPRKATNYCRVAKDVHKNKGNLTKKGFYSEE